MVFAASEKSDAILTIDLYFFFTMFSLWKLSRSPFIFIHITMKFMWTFIHSLCWVLNGLLKSGNAGPSVLGNILILFI